MHSRNDWHGVRQDSIRTVEEAARDLPPQLRGFAADLERVLRGIDFEEVTTTDKSLFIDCAIEAQVKWLVARGRFDLAVRLRRYGEQRIAALSWP